MRNKKILSTVCLALSCAFLTACASAPKKTNFNNYWNENFLVYEPINETLVYDVTFEKDETYGYDLSYANGKYVTTLKNSVENGQNVYLYTTELSIDVTYILGEAQTTLHDSVKTETIFYPAEQGLTPLSSKKWVISSSPVAATPTKLDECYLSVNYEIITTYDENGGECVVTTDGKTTKHDFDFGNEGFSYLDSTQTLLALRALPMRTSSTRVLSYNPFTRSVQKTAIVARETASAEFSFYKNGSAEKQTQTISYRPVQFQLDEKRPGFAQTAWIATTSETVPNTHRNVMLRLEQPVYRSMGTFVYQLSSSSYVL